MDETPVYRLQNIVHAPQELMEHFEGPLDLILFLLQKGKIEIQDLQISLLCEQFLGWIETHQHLDMEIASEFISMASHLVYIKSRKLLSYGDDALEEIDELKLKLEERLLAEERQKLNRTTAFLKMRDNLFKQYLPKPPESIIREDGYEYQHKPAELLAALNELFQRGERRTPPDPSVFASIVGPEPYPVTDKVQQLMRMMNKTSIFNLSVFLVTASDRSELVASFLAVLELCKNGKVDIIYKDDDEIWLKST